MCIDFIKSYFTSIDWVSIISLIASIVALIVSYLAYKLQRKSDKDLKRMDNSINEINKVEKKIQENTENINEITLQMQNNVNKSYFKIERTTALNKYPEREEFKKINEAYLSFILHLFDHEQNPNIMIQIEPNRWLEYEIEFVKDDTTKIPKNKTFFSQKFYIIKIISPANTKYSEDEKLKKYEKSPIKEGEYYSCRFDEERCSWILGENLSLGNEYEGFYKFYVSTFTSGKAEGVFSANEIMKCKQNNGLHSKYQLIDEFLIDGDGNFPARSGSKLRLFKKDNRAYFTINNSPLKEIYILKTFIGTEREKFLTFENLRGHIKNESFIESLKDRVLKKIKRNSLDERIMDASNYSSNHHIKIPLEDTEMH